MALTAKAYVQFTVPELEGERSDMSLSLRDADGQALPDFPDDGRAPAFAAGGYAGWGLVGSLWPGEWTLELHA